MKNVTKYMTASEVRALIGRLMVKCDDLKRQKALISFIVWKEEYRADQEMDNEQRDDLKQVLNMLDVELQETSESVRELKAILASKQ